MLKAFVALGFVNCDDPLGACVVWLNAYVPMFLGMIYWF
jgi:hypothetical protein